MPSSLFDAGAPDVLYLVDLSSYVLRAYHAVAPLTSPQGEPTHAVHGTVTMLERLLRERRPARVGVAMDSGRVTFRKEIFPDYKANRPPAPDNLRSQLKRCEEIVRAQGLAVFKQGGVEADDLIASAVRAARAADLRVIIVGADKDLMQLVTPEVLMWDTMRNKVFGPAEVEERFGVSPAALGDLLALMGDTSDNIPGVPSVGPKTAAELIAAHGDLDGIFAALDTVKRKKLRETLEANEERARLSRRLVTLKDDCEVDIPATRMDPARRELAALEALYTELGFQRQLTQLHQERPATGASGAAASAPINAPPPTRNAATASAPRADGVPVAPGEPLKLEHRVITDEATLSALLATLAEADWVSLEAFGVSLDAHQGDLIGVAVATRRGEHVTCGYVPLGHRYVGAPHQLAPKQTLASLCSALSSAKALCAYDSKRTRVYLEDAGASALPAFTHDARLASYLIDPERSHALEALATELGVALPDYDSVTKQGRRRTAWDEIEVEPAARYAAARSLALLSGIPRQREQLEELGLEKLFDEIELPLASQLAVMQELGVLIDTQRLGELNELVGADLIQLEARAHEVAGKPFNVNSPRQLETLLFDELGLKPLKRTKTSRSTDAATLEALADEHPLPEVILQIRQLAKLKGTYIEALPALVSPTTGRVHGSWEQAVAATGRISSTEPNLQNIPIRTELGRRIREAFVAPPGCCIVSADYSQIELRVLAHLSGDERLVEAFKTGQDVHTRTAMEIFEVDEAGVTRELRTRAKAVNFGVIYGQGESGLSKSLGIARDEAARFIAAYFRRYEGVRAFMQETLQAARSGEAVHSILGRRRIVPDIGSGNRARRLAAERVAMNMPIQGSAADLLKLAMLALRAPVTAGARMVLTVHDELVFEVPEAEVEEAKALIRQKMEGVYDLRVPLVVDVGHGANWNAAH